MGRRKDGSRVEVVFGGKAHNKIRLACSRHRRERGGQPQRAVTAADRAVSDTVSWETAREPVAVLRPTRTSRLPAKRRCKRVRSCASVRPLAAKPEWEGSGVLAMRLWKG